MIVFDSLEEAQAIFGDIIVSKLACLVKEVPGSSEVKRRLLVDMLRSGSNRCARVPERSVLPRLRDAAGDVRRLAFVSGPGECVEILVIDVSDAFFAIGVKRGEIRFQAVLGPGGRIYLLAALSMGVQRPPSSGGGSPPGLHDTQRRSTTRTP